MSEDMPNPFIQGSSTGDAVNERDFSAVETSLGPRHSAVGKCTRIAAGHEPHWGPVLHAANGPKEDWVPVQVVQVQGTQAVLRSPWETLTVYNHDPQRLAEGVEFNHRWNILSGKPQRDSETGQTSYKVAWVSREPISACSDG